MNETFYTQAQVAVNLKFSATWVRDRLGEGAFGPDVIRFADGDVRIPLSGVNGLLNRSRFFPESAESLIEPGEMLEQYLAVEHAAALTDRSESWVRDRIRAGDIGLRVLRIGNDVRIPVSGFNAFLRVQARWGISEAIRARNMSELRRKAGKGSIPSATAFSASQECVPA